METDLQSWEWGSTLLYSTLLDFPLLHCAVFYCYDLGLYKTYCQYYWAGVQYLVLQLPKSTPLMFCSVLLLPKSTLLMWKVLSSGLKLLLTVRM